MEKRAAVPIKQEPNTPGKRRCLNSDLMAIKDEKTSPKPGCTKELATPDTGCIRLSPWHPHYEVQRKIEQLGALTVIALTEASETRI